MQLYLKKVKKQNYILKKIPEILNSGIYIYIYYILYGRACTICIIIFYKVIAEIAKPLTIQYSIHHFTSSLKFFDDMSMYFLNTDLIFVYILLIMN